MSIIVTLDSGEDFRVRQLGLFELDDLVPDSIGPFTYEMEVMGKTHHVVFDISRYETPPPPPTKSPSEIKPNTREHDDYIDWQLYHAALLHNQKRLDTINTFYMDIKRYIIANACEDDPAKLISLDDWRKVYDAALVPQLTMEIIAATLEKTYAAKFNGLDIFEALTHARKGRGAYDVIKLWENQLMIKMQLSELEYSMLPLAERARKVCAMFLDDIMAFLEIDFEAKLHENKSKIG